MGNLKIEEGLELILEHISPGSEHAPITISELWSLISAPEYTPTTDAGLLDPYQTASLMIFQPAEIITAVYNSYNTHNITLLKTAAYILYDKSLRNPHDPAYLPNCVTLKMAADMIAEISKDNMQDHVWIYRRKKRKVCQQF